MEENEDLIEGFKVMVCYKQLFCEFWDQCWVLQSFTKYFEINKRIREMYIIFQGKLKCWFYSII